MSADTDEVLVALRLVVVLEVACGLAGSAANALIDINIESTRAVGRFIASPETIEIVGLLMSRFCK